jgi:2-C-methyl-D-erythritol 4-phosphate cytidylyltransferase
MKDRCGAVIVAAGNSRRMGGKDSKIFLDLCGGTVLERCLEVFNVSGCVHEIVVVCRPEDMPRIKNLAGRFRKVQSVVAGGETRRQSVENGLRALSPVCTLIAVHDGARPLVTEEEIEKVVADAGNFGAATLATPVKDTIKFSDQEGFISSTPERKMLWAVQTPQVFRRTLYEEAVEAEKNSQEDITDDCQLLERLGRRVKLTEGRYSNLKITTPEDLPAARALWKELKKG